MWQEINRYKTVTDDGTSEEYILERNENGTFRIRNEFGNIKIEFDAMSGVEFIRRLFEDVQSEIEFDLNDLWSDEDTDPGGDCNGQSI